MPRLREREQDRVKVLTIFDSALTLLMSSQKLNVPSATSTVAMCKPVNEEALTPVIQQLLAGAL